VAVTRRTVVVSLAVIVACQWLLFRHFCVAQIIPAYPRGYDQTAYLGTAYDIYDALRDRGWAGGLAVIRQVDAPQGVLLQTEAAFAQLLVGPGRLGALAVNFAHLAIFEAALLAMACWIHRPALGLAVCGLLASVRSLHYDVGGMSDFRLDFAALCLFGTLACLAMRSASFRRAGWSALFGLVAGVLLLTRTIFVAYLLPGALIFAGVLLAARTRDREAVRVRLINLAMAGGIMAVIALPSLLPRVHAIAAYYVAGHTSSEAPLRAREYGAVTQLDHLAFYARSAIVTHAGPVFLVLCVAVMATLVRSSRERERLAEAPVAADDDEPGRLTPVDAWRGLAWLAATMGAAYGVLTADVAKSPVVGGVFVAMALPAALFWAALPGTPREHAGWRVAVLLLVCVAGQGFYARQMLRHGSIAVDSADMRAYGRVIDAIARLSQRLDRPDPVVSFDAVTEYSHVGVLKVLAFERLHVRLSPRPGLGGISIGVPAISQAEADEALGRSDFALLGIDRDPHGPELYPVNASLRALAPHLYDKASRDMVRIDEAVFFGRHVTLFMKPEEPTAGSRTAPSRQSSSP
jgi:hypothetical protein